MLLFPILETVDVTTNTFIVTTIIATFVIYTLLFFVVYVWSRTLVRFQAIKDVDKFTWCAKLTKVFYFPIPILTGLWFLLVDDTLRSDIANGTSKSSFIAIYLHVGFNILDCILMAVGKVLFGRAFSSALFIHHFLVLTMYSIGLNYFKKAHYLALLGFIYEIAGPLSYINWILSKAKLNHLRIWKINQRISVYLWHFRTLLDFYIFYTLFKNWKYAVNDIPMPLLISYFVSVIAVCIGLTPHWTKAEAKKLYKTYSKRSIEYILKQIEENEKMNDKVE